ncbi:MAG: hypothetical protein KJZ86_20725 [Caldilineaceae bacterium]|nr:hypothetical protein [Caldilineaceae bacterium]
MLYRDLIHFEPLESVIQLRDADEKEDARRLVETYVISRRMEDQLINLVIPQLRMDRAADNKGVLVVGNYGTGKSHLMSVISALAEHADLAESIGNPRVREAVQPIAGRFQVVRAELGGVTRSLRDSVLDELERFLEEAGTPFPFPQADAVTNNKEALIRAVDGFAQRYPEQGILFVLDELLDFLRSREQRALILDLGFLRELGEIVESVPFRFVAGVQETLFDNPRFSFVADQLRRVRDRFEQVHIAREDIAFVVAERLLKKTDEQLARITEHLRAFAPFYPPLAERLDEFAHLFPIHPGYIETFEKVYIAEKREVLRTFSQAIRQVLDAEVPSDQTGLISYDHYWGMILDNPSLRTLPGVAEVVEKSNVLAGRVQNAYTRKPLLPLAQRIIRALSVHRLTTADINTPIGVTAEELRDSLCLWSPMPGAVADADFLLSSVETALKEILRTVSGQFITANEANGQYYLDLRKVVDFDAKIAERGDFMDEADLNRYFYAALQQLLNMPTSVHVTGYQIWKYELPWAAKSVTRPGYFFFGQPNERSTAQPPRDFYVYILPPFQSQAAATFDPQPDEVHFALTSLDAEFGEIVRAYAGAAALAQESATYRPAYADKADAHLRRLTRWLGQNIAARLQVTYQGVSRTVSQVLAQTRSSASQDTEELLKVLAAHLLAPHFGDAYPDYPAFSRLREPISEAARPTAAMDAIRFLAGRGRTNLAVAVLDGLKLLDSEERFKPLQSPYARHWLEMLQSRGETQVVNQGEVLVAVAAEVFQIYKDPRFQLEPEWVAVCLLALVYDGQIVLNLGGNEALDAGSIERAATKAIGDLTDFRFYARPRELPLTVWQLIFDGLGLQSGLLRDGNTQDQAVRALQAHVLQSELGQIVLWQGAVQGGLRLWNESLFTDRLRLESQGGQVVEHSPLPPVALSQTDLLPYLRQTKEFLEGLGRYNTPGKLRNLRTSAPEAGQALTDRRIAMRTGEVLDVVNGLQAVTAYLSEAQANLPPEHPWNSQADAARQELLDGVRRLAKGEERFNTPGWQRRLERLRADYVALYSDLHREFVLGPAEDDRRIRIQQDGRVGQLKQLAHIDILNRAELDGWISAITAIKTCREYHPGLLADGPTCPRCHFRPVQVPSQPAAQLLERLNERLDTLVEQWHGGLRRSLQSETAQASMASMTPQERQPLDAYLALDDPARGPLPAGLVQSAQRALRGLQSISLNKEALVEALKSGGLPCTVEELAQRFSAFLSAQMRGHDRQNTRLTID